MQFCVAAAFFVCALASRTVTISDARVSADTGADTSRFRSAFEGTRAQPTKRLSEESWISLSPPHRRHRSKRKDETVSTSSRPTGTAVPHAIRVHKVRDQSRVHEGGAAAKPSVAPRTHTTHFAGEIKTRGVPRPRGAPRTQTASVPHKTEGGDRTRTNTAPRRRAIHVSDKTKSGSEKTPRGALQTHTTSVPQKSKAEGEAKTTTAPRTRTTHLPDKSKLGSATRPTRAPQTRMKSVPHGINTGRYTNPGAVPHARSKGKPDDIGISEEQRRTKKWRFKWKWRMPRINFGKNIFRAKTAHAREQATRDKLSRRIERIRKQGQVTPKDLLWCQQQLESLNVPIEEYVWYMQMLSDVSVIEKENDSRRKKEKRAPSKSGHAAKKLEAKDKGPTKKSSKIPTKPRADRSKTKSADKYRSRSASGRNTRSGKTESNGAKHERRRPLFQSGSAWPGADGVTREEKSAAKTVRSKEGRTDDKVPAPGRMSQSMDKIMSREDAELLKAKRKQREKEKRKARKQAAKEKKRKVLEAEAKMASRDYINQRVKVVQNAHRTLQAPKFKRKADAEMANLEREVAQLRKQVVVTVSQQRELLKRVDKVRQAEERDRLKQKIRYLHPSPIADDQPIRPAATMRRMPKVSPQTEMASRHTVGHKAGKRIAAAVQLQAPFRRSTSEPTLLGQTSSPAASGRLDSTPNVHSVAAQEDPDFS